MSSSGALSTVPGPQGPPGGIIGGADLSGLDLNNVTAPGIYRKNSTGTGLLALNYPHDTDSGVLMVLERVAGATIIQEWHSFSPSVGPGNGVFFRVLNGAGNWQPWRFMARQRVDQTAGRAIYTYDYLNNREQLVYGDTGWRQVKTDLMADYDQTTSNLYIKRSGYKVTVQFDLYPAVANTTPTNALFYNVPVGFQSTLTGSLTDAVVYGETGASVLPTSIVMRNNGGGLDFLLAARAPSNMKFFRGGATWETTQAWPTALPGVAVGIIPNI